ncbi:ABC transporter substrate binding protein [Beggiatoa leptomitoformis]|uniref:ABC transporter substrate-binding protein n=1 Tax=Beggiatoa leptomitoformis TaxID=288004 RepID=A0A2N9YFE9_9GAMM|nr:ABC transporter substrate binding protein [Beggiatoa leptomitoformis]ALG68464.1 ABC transporter substrate-binding protein [Beggiatoa leptomitoformis]AUI69204.1 ABC transporter substrate-binding protein [Beggiatoa leptomitoformis]
MKRIKRFFYMVGCVFLISVLCGYGYAADKGTYSTAPTLHQGKKWRIGYLEGGTLATYPLNVIAIVKGLEELEWLSLPTIPKLADSKDTKALWQWLVQNVKSDYIEFVAEAYWSSNWDEKQRPVTKATVIKYLNEKQDIDLMLALGTWAGQDLANDEHHVATIVASTSDALASKIIKSATDSGFDHLHAKVDVTRFERQIRLFNDVVNFKKLGVVYEDTDEGRSFAAIPIIQTVANERKFDVVSCYAAFSGVEIAEAENNVLRCYKEIAPKVEAVYVTIHRGITAKTLPVIAQNLIDNKVASFAQQGSSQVQAGVLLSMASPGFQDVGRFYAATIAKIFNGAKPRELSQIFEDPIRIAINMATANLIGFEPPIVIFGIADEIYQDIEVPK